MIPNTNIGLCETLTALLGREKVSLPGSASYNASLSSYFSLQSIAVHPVCIVSPQTVRDVSALIGSLTATASNGSCEVAIRSGGHMWFVGASNAPSGVTVDLRGLDSIDLSADNSTISVGVGATWDAVYGKLDPLGLSVAGGRVAGVGVGGLTIGGGISYFGPRYGWTCNTASAFEVVLADGSVVEANEEQNSDLFHGLRGGSNNFGIVTRIDLNTFSQGPIWYSSTYNPLSTIDDQIKIFAKNVVAENYDENASFITGFGYSQSKGLTVINNELAYTKPAESPPSFYQEFLSLPSIYNSSSVTNATALSQNVALLLPPGVARYLFATVTFRPTEAMLRAAFDAWNSSLTGIKDINGLTWSLSLEPLPPAIYQRGSKDNAMGLADRTDTLVVCLLSQAWADEADDERVYAASAALVVALQEVARSLNAYDPFIYLNYAAPWQDPIASYGEESVQKLRELRARVDPTGVFTRLVPGGFKIPSDDVRK
ncbi:putative oxidoreductase [Annulohypoxylon truncatum]|uniref:putative oxidoreductase n=1 Tax=Annulohypoxylon truncatum TaxID=327061 RepID=UPI00200728D7|nr:putative oxidoreductase [Annulohypoxylon truncatum]KAI1211125.1 putative oxidoreductase [Annulohypoxylon truncatum]